MDPCYSLLKDFCEGFPPSVESGLTLEGICDATSGLPVNWASSRMESQSSRSSS